MISYLILMSVLGEDDLCIDSAWRMGLISYFLPHGASGPFSGTSPRWISSRDTSIQFGQGGFEVSYPSQYNLVQHCYHGLPPALHLYSFVLPTETPVPNGQFNPRSDRHFNGSWQDSVSVVEGAKGPQEHLGTGSAELEITVKSVSERKARKKRDEYRDPDPQDGSTPRSTGGIAVPKRPRPGQAWAQRSRRGSRSSSPSASTSGRR
jgi:hypothetical protein